MSVKVHRKTIGYIQIMFEYFPTEQLRPCQLVNFMLTVISILKIFHMIPKSVVREILIQIFYLL